MRSFLSCALAALGITFASLATADNAPVDYAFLPVPEAAASRPVPKYQFVFGAPARWPAALRWRYNHDGAPPGYDAASVVAGLSRAFDSWSAVCNVAHAYEGPTGVAPNTRPMLAGSEQPDYANVIGWGAVEGNAAALTYAWYRTLGPGRELVDTDVILSPAFVNSGSMERTATHEWGHALGLAHSDLDGALMSGPPLSQYNGLAALRHDDVRGCRCLYGAPASRPDGFACSLPPVVDLGAVPVNAPSSPRALAIVNDGNGPLVIHDVRAAHGAVTATGCGPGTAIPVGGTCTLAVTAVAAAEVPGEDLLTLQGSDGPYVVKVRFTGAPRAAADAGALDLVEYHHAAFGHYFVTSLADEITSLDAGRFAGWQRTGRTLRGWAGAMPGSVPVCRFFTARFAPKSSHFYTANNGECEGLRAGGDWQFEGEVFHVALPDDNGACGTGLQPVYRLYNDGRSGAPNHRYTTDREVQAVMLAQGWIAEGRGVGVAMCVPR